MNRLFKNCRERAGGPRRPRRGISLVDIVLGVWVLCMVILTLASVDVTGMRTVRQSQSVEIATQAARGQLDHWRRQGFNNLPVIASGETSVTQSFTPPAALPAATGQIVFTRVDENQTPTTTETGRRRVAATVNWAGRGNDRGPATLTTLIVKWVAL